jgi:hypothetical protein
VEDLGRAVVRVMGSGGAEPVAPDARVVPARRRGAEVVLPAMSPQMPSLSRSLQAWVARAAEPPAPPRDPGAPKEIDGGVVSVPARLPPTPATAAEKEAAREPAERLRRILAAQADDATVEAWLRRATAACANGPSDPEARRGWVSALVLLGRGRPDAIFSAETAVEAIGRWTYWPAGGVVKAFLDEIEERYRVVLRGLEAVERAPVATGPGRERPSERELPAERTEEEIAAVQAAAAVVAGELRAREAAEAARRPLRPEPRYFSTRQLIAQLEHEIWLAGGPGCRPALDFRLVIERRKLGIGTEAG